MEALQRLAAQRMEQRADGGADSDREESHDMSRRKASKPGEKCGYTDDERCIVTPGLSDLLWTYVRRTHGGQQRYTRLSAMRHWYM